MRRAETTVCVTSLRIGQAGELNEPDAIRIALDPIGRHLERQPRLAGTTGADEGDEARA